MNIFKRGLRRETGIIEDYLPVNPILIPQGDLTPKVEYIKDSSERQIKRLKKQMWRFYKK